MNCPVCNKPLGKRNKSGYCKAHVNASPIRKAYMATYNAENKTQLKAKLKVYRVENKVAINKDWQNRYNTDLHFRLAHNLRTRLNNALKRNTKAGSAVKDLGCAIAELKVYLESKFDQEMTWDNWTRDGWHIDHIKPLTAFDLSDPEQFSQACHYTNLQPLWSELNIAKGGASRLKNPQECSATDDVG